MLFLLALEKLEDKERELIGRLYDDYSKRVKEICYNILQDDKSADDAVNDTFLKVINYKEEFIDVPEAERVRLIIIYARSVCFNIYNKSKKIRFDSIESFKTDENDNEVRFDIAADDDTLKSIVEKETGIYLENAINKLKSPVREMIIMKYFRDMKNAEIAKFYKMNASTVSTLVQRSMNQLRCELEGYLGIK